MKFYSTKTGKLYETEKECLKAEKDFDEQQKIAEKKAEEEKASKKEMANRIEQADAGIDTAKEEYKKIKEELVEKLRKDIEDAEVILKEARAKIEEAEEKKYEAISEFNKKFGTYSKVYSGEKAYNEFKKSLDYFNSFFPFM